MDLSEVITAQIRALQAIHAEAHQALQNWGRWSRDRRGIFPSGIQSPRLYDAFDRSEWDKDGYGEEQQPDQERLEQDDRKAERPEVEPYDEKSACEINDRIHGYGGLPAYVREAIKVAYVSREIPEDQFHRYAGCTPDAFRERLESALIFVGRFTK